MKKLNVNLSAFLMMAMTIFSLSACNDDSENSAEPVGSGEVTFEMTDAPIDNAEVRGVFVTVTDIKVDGESFEGFEGPQTINLLAYQNGKTELVGQGELSAKSYNNLSLVLDIDQDAAGNSPGSYVRTADGTKHRLASSAENTLEITSNKAFTVSEDATSKVVIDFDLRKAIQLDESGDNEYSFVAASKLNNAVRVVARENAGTIKGQYSDQHGNGNDSDKVVVYAYKKGSFNAETETSGELLFENAANSALVSGSSFSSGNFTLAFLEEGEYELHFARYSPNSNGRLSFDTMLELSSNGNASLNNIKLDAGTEIELSLSITGIIR